MVILGIGLGSLFIISAYFKLQPVEPFEYKIVGTTWFGWQSSVFVARIIIALEFSLGVLLLFSYKLKTTLKLSVGLLALFSLHLIYVLWAMGNIADCGCMGSLMTFTPLQGLAKNVFMILACLLMYKVGADRQARISFIPLYVFLITLITVMIVEPVDLHYAKTYLDRPFETFELNLDTIYNAPASETVQRPQQDIRDKKVLLAFMSATCPHCRIAAQKLGVISRKNPDIPIYMFINGDKAEISAFLEQTETSHIPSSHLGKGLFVPLAGLNLPVLYYYNKGTIDKRVTYLTLEQQHLEDWLKH